jgi:hypothetical protein
MSESFRLQRLTSSYTPILIAYLLACIIFTVQALLLDEVAFAVAGPLFPQYNNYLIFKQSFFHLINNKDLYSYYPIEQGDLFKYSPTFALFFGPLAYMPDAVGLSLWNLTNTLFLFVAFRMLPRIPLRDKVLMMALVLVELITSLQNVQSNALIAGMIVLAFACMENEKYFIAALLIVGTVFIKLFGVVAFVLFLFYPQKGRVVAYAAICGLVLGLLPLLVVSMDQLIILYKNWLGLLINDHDTQYGISLIGWLTTWFMADVDKNLVVLAGVALFLLPLVKTSRYGDYQFRLFMLASVLIWIVIFNHMAESPTYVIAMAGVAVWYFSQSPTTVNFSLVILAFVFTSLSPTDLFPSSIQDNYFDPYVVKAVPCIVIWAKIVADTVMMKSKVVELA